MDAVTFLDSKTSKYYFIPVKMTSKGQVTIPLPLRKQFGLGPRTEVEFAAGENGVVIRPARTSKKRFRDWIRKARGSAAVKTSTDKIMALTRGED